MKWGVGDWVQRCVGDQVRCVGDRVNGVLVIGLVVHVLAIESDPHAL